jgi:hypothetical protein
MTGKLVLSGLILKRAELAGQIEETKHALAALIRDIDAIDHAIRLFDPSINVLAIPAKTKRMTKSRAQLGGDVGRDVLDILRTAGVPLSIDAIASRILIDRRLDGNDERLGRVARGKVYAVLRRYSAQGLLRPLGSTEGWHLWEITR